MSLVVVPPVAAEVSIDPRMRSQRERNFAFFGREYECMLAAYLMRLTLLVLSVFGSCLLVGASLQPLVEIEEVVYEYQPANNGAGPMWCAGSTCMVRVGDSVFATALETLADEQPLNNCRWVLMERGESGWKRKFVDSGRTREPSPMVGFHDGQVFVSGNPTLGQGPEPGGGPSRPEIKRFKVSSDSPQPQQLLPPWKGQPSFREHSYRSFAADGERGEFILFQNIGYGHAEWSFRNEAGEWSASGQIEWPLEKRYHPPRPLRLCYPNVALKDRAVHFFGVGDIIEPNKAWREYKKELTGRKWDYVFRQLYYCSTADIEEQGFGQWIEVASREATAGFLWPCDMWIDDAGRVHLLWTEQAIDTRLREPFFPDAKQSNELNYAIVVGDRIIERHTLMQLGEGERGLVAGRARFHPSASKRLYVVGYFSGTDQKGVPVSENRLYEIRKGGQLGTGIRIPLERPFTNFFTATPRGGSMPSKYLDLLGVQSGQSQKITYARVRLE